MPYLTLYPYFTYSWYNLFVGLYGENWIVFRPNKKRPISGQMVEEGEGTYHNILTYFESRHEQVDIEIFLKDTLSFIKSKMITNKKGTIYVIEDD